MKYAYLIHMIYTQKDNKAFVKILTLLIASDTLSIF